MRSSDADIFFIPGLDNSDADHWQSRWETRLSTGRRIEQDDWRGRDRTAWTSRIREAVERAERPAVLIGHSLGASAVAHAAEGLPPGKVRGAFLVTPPAPRMVLTLPDVDPAFAEQIPAPLTFPTLLVASRDDPYSMYEELEALAADWGATLVDAGPAGHINTASGHGPWPEGLMRFANFLSKL